MESRVRTMGSRVIGVAVGLTLVALLAACGGQSRELAAPEQSVQQLLELRAERSVDASAYAEFLLEPALAQELASASQSEAQADSAIAPTPDWEQPYISAEEDSAADVVVVWIADDAHPDWPIATVFDMSLIDGRWVAGDANAVEGTGAIPPPLN